MAEKYQWKKKPADRSGAENEIRVTARGRTATYISYASTVFNEKEMDHVVVKATGGALATCVTVAEIIKRRFKGLHQLTNLGSVEVEDTYEPMEDGLEEKKQTRTLSFIEITLSKKPLDKKNKGYQPPLPEDEVEELNAEEVAARGRRRPRKEKEEEEDDEEDEEEEDEEDAKPSKGKGKGKKGKGKKGKGKGKDSKGKGKGKGKKGKGKGKGKKGKDEDSSEKKGSRKGKGKRGKRSTDDE